MDGLDVPIDIQSLELDAFSMSTVNMHEKTRHVCEHPCIVLRTVCCPKPELTYVSMASASMYEICRACVLMSRLVVLCKTYALKSIGG